jgi:hypothetical protein
MKSTAERVGETITPKSKKLGRVAALLGGIGLLVAGVGPASATTPQGWNQGFEADASGWFGSIGRVASDPSGVISASGDAHALVNGSAYSFFGGSSDEFNGKWVAELDVYLDPAWTAGTGFDYSVAAYGTDGTHQRDFIFHVTSDTSTGQLLVAGSNNSNFAPREDLDTLVNNYRVQHAGWYTLRHTFRDNGGFLAVDLQLVDDNGVVVFTETRSTSADTIPAEVGGNGYSWFTFVNVTDLAVDNHRLTAVAADKDGCKKDGWQNLRRADWTTFADQGDCVRYVNTGA